MALCAHCDKSIQPTIGNIGQAEESLKIEIPAPAAFPKVLFSLSESRRQLSMRVDKYCPADGVRIDGEHWVKVLKASGFVAQTGGWVLNGPVAIRFRKGDVVGDIFASAEYPLGRKSGCRDYRIRAQKAVPGGTLFCTEPFTGGLEGICIPLFAPLPQFPFPEDYYCM